MQILELKMEIREIGNTGVKVSTLGLGGAPLGGNFVDLDDNQAANVVSEALLGGLTYFDTAPWYGFGRSERTVGNMLRGKKVTISTKAGRILKPGAVPDPENYGMINPLPFNPIYDYSYDGIMRAYEDSLQRLGIDRIDILLVHDIGTFQHGEENEKYFNELKRSGYQAVNELRVNGDIKAIGLGVNENKICLDALEIGDWDVFLLAGRYTLLEQTSLDELFPKCKLRNTSIICAGPFNSGVLVGREMWNYANAPQSVLEKVSALKVIADNHGVSLPAAALQFPLANPLVRSVIPGPRSGDEVVEILKWFSARIPDKFWKDLKSKGLLDERAPVPN